MMLAEAMWKAGQFRDESALVLWGAHTEAEFGAEDVRSAWLWRLCAMLEDCA